MVAIIGIGDNLLAAGMARGAAKRGKRVAFGDGKKIIWDQNSELIFRGNPNIAVPALVTSADNLKWVPFYRGHRIYNRQVGDRWEWNYEFRATPGEVFLNREEQTFNTLFGKGFVLIEPNLPAYKRSSANKEWPSARYEELSVRLGAAGYQVNQFFYSKARCQLKSARLMKTANFRLALSVMQRAALYIGPEGGLHHGAAAMGRPAVVLFGGFIPPQVTGYETHTNLTGGAEACGSLSPCEHCRAAMEAITVDEVYDAAIRHLQAPVA